MMRIKPYYLFLFLYILFHLFDQHCIVLGDSTFNTKDNTQTVKQKLEIAEKRVRDLASKLDTVSTDAGHAKKEIHSTLLEAWKVVDLLGQDRCGEVTEKFRKSQLRSENKLNELQDDIKRYTEEVESLKLGKVQEEQRMNDLRRENENERRRRKELERENGELKDRVHWAMAKSNDTQAYESVAEKLKELVVLLNERRGALEKIGRVVDEDFKNTVQWKEEVVKTQGIVQDAEKNFMEQIKDSAGGATERMKRYVESVEKRLKDAVQGRDTLQKETERLRRMIMDKKYSVSDMNADQIPGAGKAKELKNYLESKRYGDWKNLNSVGFWTLVVVTFCCGMLLARYLSMWQEKLVEYNGEDPALAGMRYTPGRSPVGTPGSGYVRPRYESTPK